MQSKEAKNLSKQAIRNTEDLVMIFKDKDKGGGIPKRKANGDNKCYNCHKLRHFGQDYFFQDRRLNRNIQYFQREKS